jgi:hypothetical protein
MWLRLYCSGLREREERVCGGMRRGMWQKKKKRRVFEGVSVYAFHV